MKIEDDDADDADDDDKDEGNADDDKDEDDGDDDDDENDDGYEIIRKKSGRDNDQIKVHIRFILQSMIDDGH